HHERDQHDAPLDPNFHGAGRVFTDGDGRYRFVSIKPGAYPWRNHPNAWRPNHIHFSLFGPTGRARLVAAFDLSLTQPEWALGFRFDIVLRGLHATPMEGAH